jgi:hypothetical protein
LVHGYQAQEPLLIGDQERAQKVMDGGRGRSLQISTRREVSPMKLLALEIQK